MIAATVDTYRLGEGPTWDGARDRLLWVDILGRAAFEGRLDADGTVTVTARHDADGMVSAVVFADDGSLLLAVEDHLVVIDPDGERRVGPGSSSRGAGGGPTTAPSTRSAGSSSGPWCSTAPRRPSSCSAWNPMAR